MKFKSLIILFLVSVNVAFSQTNVTFFGSNEVVFIHDDTCNNSQWVYSSLLMTGFPPGAAIEGPEDLRMICLNIEHSNVSDLQVKILCPSWSPNILSNGGSGGNADLGVANLTDNAAFHCDSTQNPRGIGWNYCWSSSNYSYQGSLSSLSGGSSPIDSTYISAGTHFITPDNSFDMFLGCPLEGVWALGIRDLNANNENGYLFSWNIGVASEILAPIDLGATAIYTPSDTMMKDSSIFVKVRIHNFGEGQVDSIPVAYRLDDMPEHVEYYSPFLFSDSNAVFEFQIPFVSDSVGFHHFCAYTKAVGDVQLSNDTICKTIFVKSVDDTGIGNINDVNWNEIAIFPNPSNQFANIQFNNHKSEVVTFILYDLLGNVVKSFSIPAGQGKNQFMVSLETLEEGIYPFSLNCDAKRYGKLIVII